MGEKETIDLLIEGGKASPGPTTAPKLGAFKLNIAEVFRDINEKTKEYAGMQVPVKLIIDKETKGYKIEVGLPSVSSLIKKELGIKEEKKEKALGAGEEDKKVVTVWGDLKMQQCVKIAKMKMDDLLTRELKSAVKMIIGSAVSMPITIEGKKPKEILKEIDVGKWDEAIK